MSSNVIPCRLCGKEKYVNEINKYGVCSECEIEVQLTERARERDERNHSQND